MPLAPTASQAVATSLALVGYKEGPNNANRFAAETPGLAWAKNQPWCASQQSWVGWKIGAAKAGITPITASTDAALEWFRVRSRFFTKRTNIKVADWIFFGKKVKAGNGYDAEHVELVVQVELAKGYVLTVGGNTSSGDKGSQANGDGTYLRKRPLSSTWILGVGRPAYQPDPKPAPKPAPVPVTHKLPKISEPNVVAAFTKGTHHPDDVKPVQRALGFTGDDVDGIPGPLTKTKVASKQRFYGMKGDGIPRRKFLLELAEHVPGNYTL